MKKQIILFVLILTSNLLSAQIDFEFGVKAGINYGYKGELTEVVNGKKLKENSTKVGWSAGIFTRINLLSLYIQPELYYSQFKNQFDDFSITSKRLDIPVIVGKEFFSILRLGIGPVFSANFNDKISMKQIEKISRDDFTIGGQLRAGVDISKISLDIGYEFGLNKTQTKFVRNVTDTYKVDKRPSMLLVSVGYKF